MYGLPGQDLQKLQESVESALGLGVQHISIYGLQLEPGTVFDKMQQQGRLMLPSDELTEAMYDYIAAVLRDRGIIATRFPILPCRAMRAGTTFPTGRMCPIWALAPGHTAIGGSAVIRTLPALRFIWRKSFRAMPCARWRKR